MPSQRAPDPRDRSIKDFFKPFTVPKHRRPDNDVIEEEIIVASPKPSSPSEKLRMRKPSETPTKRKNGYKSSQVSSSSGLSSLASTRTRAGSAPRPSPKKPLPLPQLDGAVDATILTSPSSSQRRVMTAVEIPSPDHKQPDFKPEPQPPRLATASFSSISTLSSIPMSTQSSSRRVIKNGLQAVTNSDSGSAEEEESSSGEELADLSTFIPRKKMKMTPPPGQSKEEAIEIPSTIKPVKRQSARISGGEKRSNATSSASTPGREASPPRAVYKYSLLNMVKQREKESKAEARIKELERSLEEAEKKRAEETELENDGQGGLKVAVADDSDEGERMVLALQRTEAGDGEEKFFYFRGIRDRLWDHEELMMHYLAESNAEDIPWLVKFKDKQWRTHACLSGFVAEIVAKQSLPDLVRRWMGGQLLSEKSEELCEAYVEILEACCRREDALQQDLDFAASKDEDAEPSRDPTHHDWRNVGLHYEFNDVHDEQHSFSPSPAIVGAPPGLAHFLRLSKHCSPLSGNGLTFDPLLPLIYAAIDANVAKDPSLKPLIADTIETMLDRVSLADQVKIHERARYGFLRLPRLSNQLMCRAIVALPASTTRSHELRRSLAMAFIMDHGLKREEPCHARWYGDDILKRLKTAPEFHISDTTNYNLLKPLIQVLDIAIDSGFYDYGFRATSSQPASPPQRQSALAKPALANNSSSSPEKIFNVQIDAFISQFTLMASRIKDAGTTHLHRTEAKSALERLARRLEYGVRTRPKKRKGVFGDGVLGMGGGLVCGFLKVPEIRVGLAEEDAVVGATEDS